MPRQHQLTAPQAVGLFGKHPGHADFISAGLPSELVHRLSDFLGSTLGAVRQRMGADWGAPQAGPPLLCFWLGGALAPSGPWRGVMALSGDKIGRRYPFVVMQQTTAQSLPTGQPDQAFYRAAGQGLHELLAQPEVTPRPAAKALAARLSDFVCPAPVLAEQSFWAKRSSDQIEQLCADVALADLVAAGQCRSYWWFSHQVAARCGILVCAGWPDAQGFAWVWGGVEGAAHGGEEHGE